MTFKPAAARWFELLTDRDHLGLLLRTLADTGKVELETRSEVDRSVALPDYAVTLAEFGELARRFRAYWPEPRGDPDFPPPESVAGAQDALAELRLWAEAAEPVVATLQRATTERAGLSELSALIDSATPAAPLLELARSKGLLSSRLYAVASPPAALPPGLLAVPFAGPGGAYVAALGTAEDCLALDRQLALSQARRIALPQELPLEDDAARAQLANRIAALDTQLVDHRQALAALEAKHHLAARLASFAFLEWLVAHVPRLPATEHFAWVTGWTSDVDGQTIERALAATGLPHLLNFPEPPRNAIVPVVLANPGWLRPFELFVRLLGTPRAGEADPTVVVAVVAPLLFGFMFGDVIQGLALLGVGAACWRRYPALRLLVPGGVSAAGFGLAFGTVGAREDLIRPLWLHPLAAPLTVLGVSVALGAAIITAGMLLDGIEHAWRGEGWRWLRHRGGIVVGYVGLLASIARPAAAIVAVAGILAAVVLPMLGEPRTAAKALGETLETVLQLLVNTVSFARVGAFALAHAGLSAAVVGIAAAGGHGALSVLLLLLGNIVILVIEGVVVGIQTTRLVLFEFFIRFLRADGRALRPLPPAPGGTASR